MRFALVGAHGTGKTTLARSVASDFQGRGLSAQSTPEIPRVICENAGDPEYFRRGNNSLLKQLMLLVGQPIFESALDSSTMCICDRSILDHWAYTRNLFLPELRSEQLLRPLEFMIVKYAGLYDAIFYIPIEFRVEDDGTREGDVAFQAAIDCEIKNLLDTHGLSYSTVAGTVEERTTSVVNYTLGRRLQEGLRDGK